jgi:DNA-binding transcriptional LysR family regulator
MKLTQLEAVVWIARLKSFRGAATRLNTTQPAISVRVQGLERELGIRLFDRIRGRVSPTSEGKDCIAIAEQIVLLASQLRARPHGKRTVTGRVSVGVGELIAHTWLPNLVAVMSERYPDVKLDITVDRTPALVRGLETGDHDVVLAGSHRLVTTFPTLELGSEPFVWVSAGGEEPASRPLRPRDLQTRHIITEGKSAAIYQSLERWFIQNGAYPTHRITCNTTVTMADMVSAGLGISLLPFTLIEKQLAAGTLSLIPTEPEFEPVRYRAMYLPAPGSLGRTVAEAAVEVSTFEGSRLAKSRHQQKKRRAERLRAS